MNVYNKLEFYNMLAVIIDCNDNRGSGCLYQPNSEDYSYVLTAKHCLKGKKGEEKDFEIEAIKVTGSEELNGGSQLRVIDYLLNEQLDIAIIIVEYVSNCPKYQIANPDEQYPSELNGYPDFTGGERKSLTCQIHEWSPNKPNFEVIVNNGQLSSYRNCETNLVEGFSGSGVFNVIGSGTFSLIGIFVAFKANSGAYQSLVVIRAEEFNMLLEGTSREYLLPSYLASFIDHIDPAFEIRTETIAMVLTKKAREIKGVTPIAIKELFNEKLVLPYGKVHLNEKNLWIGWITLLTYLYIESGNANLQKMLVRDKKGQRQDVKLFYVNNNKRIEDLFKLIMCDKDIYNDIGLNDCIVVNHEGNSGEVVRLSEKMRSKIVTNIGIPNLKYMHEVPKVPNIDQHVISKNISLIHVDCFIDEFKKLVDIDDFDELEECLKISIREVFNNE